MADQNKIENATAEAISQLTTWMKEAGEFTKDQLPELAREIINAGYLRHITALVIWVATSLIVAKLCHLVSKSFAEDANKEGISATDKDNCQSGEFAFGCFAIFSLLIGSIALLYNTYMVIYISLVPRLYLIEKVADLVNNG